MARVKDLVTPPIKGSDYSTTQGHIFIKAVPFIPPSHKIGDITVSTKFFLFIPRSTWTVWYRIDKHSCTGHTFHTFEEARLYSALAKIAHKLGVSLEGSFHVEKDF